MQYLGYQIDEKVVRPVPAKVAVITNYSKDVTELRRFLGMINFYRRFIGNAAAIQAPLNECKEERQAPHHLDRESRKSVSDCKDSVANAELLVHPK